jgi:membrane-associated phospholipid phosphatase
MYAAAGFLFLSRHRLQAFNLVALLVVSLTLQTNLKLAFAQIRPFWYWPDIRTIGGCPFQTGLPSGHSSGSVVIFWVLYYHAFPYLREAVSLILLILTGGAIAQSRLGLGAHSVNQIVFGLFIGLATVVIYDTWGRAALHSHLVNRLRTPTSARYLALVFGLHLLYCGAVALNYYCISHLISNPAI